MKKILFFCLLMLGAVHAGAQTILVLGDSISAAYKIPVESGWVSLLSQRLGSLDAGDYQVVNASISGDTTAGGLARLPALLEKYQPRKVVVELGGNDGLRGLSLTAMKDNLQAIIDLSRGQGAEVVLLGVQLPTSYGMYFNRRFTDVFEKLAAANELPLVMLGYGLLGDRALIQEDGIHPSEEAQPLLLEAIWPHLALGS